MIKLTEKQINKIKELAIKHYPNEMVVGVKNKKLIELVNTHSDPTNYFSVDTDEEFDALIHSHIIDLSETQEYYLDRRVPSKMDMITQDQLEIPFGILATDGKEATDILWFPDLERPLLGRTYISNITDCYEMVRSYYYQTYGITLMAIPREWDFWEQEPNMVLDKYKEAGFKEVLIDDMEVGDLVVLRLPMDYINHLGVYIGDDKLIHHLHDRLSIEDSVPRWRSRIVKVLHYNASKNNKSTKKATKAL